MKDIRPLVEPRGYGPEGLEGIDGALDFVPAFVRGAVEAGRAATGGAAGQAVPGLVLLLWDGVRDLTSPQVGAYAAGGVCLVRADRVGSSAGVPPPP